MTAPAPTSGAPSGATRRAQVVAALTGLAAAVALLVARSHPSPSPGSTGPAPAGSYWTCSATDSVLVDAARTPYAAYDRTTHAVLHVAAPILSSAADPTVFRPAIHLAQPCVVGANDFAVPATTIARFGDSVVVVRPDTAPGLGLVRLPDTVLVIPPVPPIPPPAVPVTPIT